MAVVVATAIATAIFSSYPKIKTLKRADINKGNVQQMVGRTELWLEAQRALPCPRYAAKIVDAMGVQLDALGLQLEGLDQNHPKAREVRSLVGEQLPEMIDSYRRIPAHLRTEQRAGATPDEQLTDSLGKISGEIDLITRQLAEGSLDDLARSSIVISTTSSAKRRRPACSWRTRADARSAFPRSRQGRSPRRLQSQPRNRPICARRAGRT